MTKYLILFVVNQPQTLCFQFMLRLKIFLMFRFMGHQADRRDVGQQGVVHQNHHQGIGHLPFLHCHSLYMLVLVCICNIANQVIVSIQ